MHVRTGLMLLVAIAGCKGEDSGRGTSTPQLPKHLALECPAGTSLVGAPSKDGAWCARPDGTRHGPVLWWHENGKVKQRGHFREGKLHGEFHAFNPDGSKFSLARFQDGHMHGHQIWWYPSGVKSGEAHYQNGRYHGAQINYDPHGRPKERNEYTHGFRAKAVVYQDGKEVSSKTFERWVPKGPAATRSHPKIPAAWQACKQDHECTLVATRCCACGARDYVGVHYRHELDARVVRPECEKVMCPQMMCQRVGARCEQGGCVSAE